MSFRVVDWIMEQDVSDHQCKLMLMVIGTYADDTGKAYPPLRAVARKSSMTMRTAQRVLQKVGENYSHVIGWEPQNGSANLYQFKCPNFLDAAIVKSRQQVAEGHAKPSMKRFGTPPNGNLAGVVTPPGGGTRTFSTDTNSFLQKGLSTEPRARGYAKGSGPRDRGAIELRIANRIGQNGFEVLMNLDASQVDVLCALERRGTLHERDIAKLRALAQGGGKR